MSLVRMCTLTVSLFRVCMCMCLRARERERREASTRASGTELGPILEAMDPEPRIIAENLQISEKPMHSTSELRFPPVQTDNLISNVGPFSPKRQIPTCNEQLQGKFTQRYLRNGLQWLSNGIDKNHEEFLNSMANQLAGQLCRKLSPASSLQEEPQVIVEESEEVDRQLICSSVEPPTPTHTIAWSDGDSCVIGSPPFTAYHRQKTTDARCSAEMTNVDEKPRTLVDELLETDKTPYTNIGGCLSGFRGSCQCSQLPNQILTTRTSACTTEILRLKAELTAGEAGEHASSRTDRR